MNNHEFRLAYIRQQVPARTLAERQAERRQIIAQHKEDIKHNPKKNLVFQFVKSAYLSWNKSNLRTVPNPSCCWFLLILVNATEIIKHPSD